MSSRHGSTPPATTRQEHHDHDPAMPSVRNVQLRTSSNQNSSTRSSRLPRDGQRSAIPFESCSRARRGQRNARRREGHFLKAEGRPTVTWHRRFKAGVRVPHAVLSELPAMIAPDLDDGVVGKSHLVEARQQPLKQHSPFGICVDTRRMHLRCPIAGELRPQVIDSDKQDVRPGDLRTTTHRVHAQAEHKAQWCRSRGRDRGQLFVDLLCLPWYPQRYGH